MRALVFLLLAVAAAPLAQPTGGTPEAPNARIAAEAEALIANGDDEAANRLVGRALDETPDDPALLTIRLQLQQRGIGLFGRPPFERRRRRRVTAQRLLRADPESPHAHDELGRQGLDDYLFDRDLIVVQDGFADVGMRHSDAMARSRRGGTRADAFNRGGRYDLARLRNTYPITGKPGMDRSAGRDAGPPRRRRARRRRRLRVASGAAPHRRERARGAAGARDGDR